jgi:drug/metabolite transporter (DMT)-like permease
MLWLLFALLAPLLWAATNILDDDLVLHRLKKPVVILTITGLFTSIPAVYLILFRHVAIPSVSVLLFGIATGALALLTYYPYYRALETTNPESAILFWNLAPVLVAIFAFVFLGERLVLIKYVAIGLLILSAIIAEGSQTEFQHRGNTKAFGWMALASVCVATESIMEKYLYGLSNTATGIAMMGIGGAFITFLMLCSRTRRRAVIGAFKKNGRLLTGNHLLDTAAVVCSNLAIAYGSVSVVSAFQGIQPLFVMMFAGIASRFFTNKQLRLAKAPQTMRVAVAVMLSVIGLWALS